MIGSEGVLSVITEIVLKLVSKPVCQKSLLAAFSSIDEAAKAASLILQKGFLPCSIEFYDDMIIGIISSVSGKTPPLADSGAHLIVQFDGHDENRVEEDYLFCGEFLMENGAIDSF
jgi:glycolate oxidase